MNKSKSIILFLFLLGMLFTVVQYLPNLKEGASRYKMELAKKVHSNHYSECQNDLDHEDGDDDSETDVGVLTCFKLVTYSLYSLKLNESKDFIYTFQITSIQSPPPKV